jgi:hypothetical protein
MYGLRGVKTVTDHPLLRELRDTLLGAGDVARVRGHIAECLACRVRMDRIAQADGLQTPTQNVVERLIDASAVVPGATSIPTASDEREPEPGELWRVGSHEALLAWVRKNFHDGAVDIVPVVLDADLADEQTVIVEMERSPLPVELGAMVGLRTHLHRDAFINRLGTLDISAPVEEVIAATREGRDTTAIVGPPVEFDDDDRIEYRQALRDLLDDLSPSGWLADSPSAGVATTGPPSPIEVPGRELAEMQAQIQYRIRAAQCIDLPADQFDTERGRSLRTLFKVAYLNTSVVVVAVHSLEDSLVDQLGLVRGCQRAMESSPDADAVCVAEPREEWECVLYSCASMREALEPPGGRPVGPAPILCGYGVVDTLSKHLEGAAPAWEAADSAPSGLGSVDMAEITARHSQASVAEIQTQGRRAIQAAKKSAWSAIPGELEEHVSRFITAVLGSVPVEDALTELRQETPRD